MKSLEQSAIALAESILVRLEISFPEKKEALSSMRRYGTLNGLVYRDLLMLLENPPQHDFWGPNDPQTPQELKSSNGELHTLQCKKCSEKNPKNDRCLTYAYPSFKRWVGVPSLVELITNEEGATVTFTGPNPDCNGLPDEVVIVNKGPIWEDRTYRANTLSECLVAAINDTAPEHPRCIKCHGKIYFLFTTDAPIPSKVLYVHGCDNVEEQHFTAELSQVAPEKGK